MLRSAIVVGSIHMGLFIWGFSFGFSSLIFLGIHEKNNPLTVIPATLNMCVVMREKLYDK